MTLLRSLCAIGAFLSITAAVPVEPSQTATPHSSRSSYSSASVPTIAPTHPRETGSAQKTMDSDASDPAPRPQCTFNLAVPTPARPCGDGTSTVYTETHTSHTSIHCFGCDSLRVQTPDAAAHGFRSCASPSVTITATTPLTAWNTQCATSSSTQITSSPLSSSPSLGATTKDQQELRRRGIEPQAACPTTLTVLSSTRTNAAGTLTLYGATTTTTTKVACGGCTLQVLSNLYGPGPLVRPTATINVATTTALVFACV